jgi:hypothetical protein
VKYFLQIHGIAPVAGGNWTLRVVHDGGRGRDALLDAGAQPAFVDSAEPSDFQLLPQAGGTVDILVRLGAEWPGRGAGTTGTEGR